MDARRQSYWDLRDFSVGHGLEVGPLHRPVIARGEGDVSYVDVYDRDRIVEHYATDPDVPVEDIPEIDFHLIQPDGTTVTLAEATARGAPFDWVMASHVIEHVPDLIGWLAELAAVVRDGGVLVLAIPDKRYCFDVHRPPTTVGHLVDAHLAGLQRPSVAAVYDYFSSVVDADSRQLWRGRIPTYDRRLHSLDEARHHMERTLAGEYVDCHVWLFTPDSFLRQMHELRVTGRSDWVVERMEPTPPGELEFRVVLRRLPRGEVTTGDQPGEVLSEGDMPDWLVEQVRGQEAERLQQRIDRLQARLAKRGRKLKRLRQRAARQEQELQALRGPRRSPLARARSALRRAAAGLRRG
jgi:SAM-dependent methyltransferase